MYTSSHAYEFDGTAKESEQPHLTAAPMLIDVCLCFFVCCCVCMNVHCTTRYAQTTNTIYYMVMLWHIEK